MSAFWRPGKPGQYASWWARCDLCRWSGPLSRFTVYANLYRGDEATICDHAWCNTPQVLAELAKLGLSHIADGYRGGK